MAASLTFYALVLQKTLTHVDGLEKLLKLLSGIGLLVGVSNTLAQKQSTTLIQTETYLKHTIDTIAGFHIVSRLRDAVQSSTMTPQKRWSRIWLTIVNICETLLMLQAWTASTSTGNMSTAMVAGSSRRFEILFKLKSLQAIALLMTCSTSIYDMVKNPLKDARLRQLIMLCDVLKMGLALAVFLPASYILTYPFGALLVITNSVGLTKIAYEQARLLLL